MISGEEWYEPLLPYTHESQCRIECEQYKPSYIQTKHSFSFAVRISLCFQEPQDNGGCPIVEALSSHMDWKCHNSLRKKKSLLSSFQSASK